MKRNVQAYLFTLFAWVQKFPLQLLHKKSIQAKQAEDLFKEGRKKKTASWIVTKHFRSLLSALLVEKLSL